MPNGLPRVSTGASKQIDKKSKFSGKLGGAWGMSVGHLGYLRTLYRSIQSPKHFFLHNLNFDISIKIPTRRGEAAPENAMFRG